MNKLHLSGNEIKEYVKQKYVSERIIKEINTYKSCDCSLDEANNLITEGITDILRKYAKKGLLTAAVITSLIISNQVSAQDLKKSNVDGTEFKKAIELADKKLKNVETQFLRQLKREGKAGVLQDYSKLSQEAKVNAISILKKEIESGKSLKDYNIRIKDVIGGDGGGNVISKDSIQSKQITVDTSFVSSASNLNTFFGKNDWQFQSDPTKEIQSILNNYLEITKIIIKTSSSTLRNSGKAEGLTWEELSQKRGEEIKNKLIEIGSYDCTGCGKEKKNINGSIIEINFEGENGDGTSGPPSPFEKNAKSIERYDELGIDSKFWKSAGQGTPLENIEDYAKYQKAVIIIQGYMIDETETEVTEYLPTYEKLVLEKKPLGTKIKMEKRKLKKTNVSVCPVTIRK